MNLQLLLKEYQTLPEFEGMILNSVNQKGHFSSTPLHIAIYRSSLDQVDTLLAATADPNVRGEYGERPLQVAVACGNTEIVERLIRAGARLELTDDDGMDTWMLSEGFGFTEQLKEIVKRVTSES